VRGWSKRDPRFRVRAFETAAVVLVAILGALAPFPAETIERLYSTGLYLKIQNVLTTASNTIPIAWLDLAVACFLIASVEFVIWRVRIFGARRAFGRNLITVAGAAAWLYLLFLALWGLNYRRVPLEQKLDYDRSRLTHAAAVSFINRAVASLNDGYAAAHQAAASQEGLEASFADTQIALGAQRLAVPGVPKRSLVSYYFRRAAIDGMTDPYFLEIIVNPDVLPVERPFVVAHEWAHLAGYASEEEASFVAWLTCVRGDAASRYSGWLAAYQHAIAALPRNDRGDVNPLDEGPRQDLQAMAARYARSSPIVRRAARGIYDEYLRANRVSEGIASYDAVVRLMIGTRFDEPWKPRPR
jgi:Protein of unknown function (DUF3810)